VRKQNALVASSGIRFQHGAQGLRIERAARLGLNRIHVDAVCFCNCNEAASEHADRRGEHVVAGRKRACNCRFEAARSRRSEQHDLGLARSKNRRQPLVDAFGKRAELRAAMIDQRLAHRRMRRSTASARSRWIIKATVTLTLRYSKI